MLYAYIIRKAFPQLGKILTDKGYKPDDLISVSGIPHILTGYVRKQLKKRRNSYDPYGVKKVWDINHLFYESLQVNDAFFNREKIISDKNSGFTLEKAKLYSMIYIDNYMNNQLQQDG